MRYTFRFSFFPFDRNAKNGTENRVSIFVQHTENEKRPFFVFRISYDVRKKRINGTYTDLCGCFFSLFIDHEISKKTSEKIFNTKDVDVAHAMSGVKTFISHRRLDV